VAKPNQPWLVAANGGLLPMIALGQKQSGLERIRLWHWTHGVGSAVGWHCACSRCRNV